MRKRWSPLKGFKGPVISESGVRSVQEEIEREAWNCWAAKDQKPFEPVLVKYAKVKRPMVRRIISLVTP
jgi:hypothetical protein